MKGIIMWFLVYFYVTGSLVLNRILIFIMVFFLIYSYSRLWFFINYILNNKKVKKYVQARKAMFNKLFYVLLAVHKWINPFIIFLTYTDKWLYKINRYVTGTRFIHYNFIIYVIMKYYVMFGLIKLIIYKYYNLWYKLYSLTIIEILFKRMYGLILSILIFTDLCNNIINILSQYNVWIYVLVYYIISTLCLAWELFYFYYFWYKIMMWYNMGYKKIASLINDFNINFEEYTKMYEILFLRSQFTWLGNIVTSLLELLFPEESNFKEDYVSIKKVREGTFFMSGRILYYKPVENRISFKYFDHLGLYDLSSFEPTFELFWEKFKSYLLYCDYFKPIREIKHKPSLFLYKNIIKLAKLYDIHNQPINRLMNWKYFEMKYKEKFYIFNEHEKLIARKNLKYFNEVDYLRAKLMFFIIWDIDYYYNNNQKDYHWNDWIIQYDSIAEELKFQIDERYDNYLLSKNFELTGYLMLNNTKILKFYDPEENMEFLNRLFDVLGLLQLKEDKSQFTELPYYVSKKFINYNNKYVELLNIMYTYDFKRWEEPMCACSYTPNYEVEITYKTEEFMQNLRLEWVFSIKRTRLEERNWNLLKRLEDLM